MSEPPQPPSSQPSYSMPPRWSGWRVWGTLLAVAGCGLPVASCLVSTVMYSVVKSRTGHPPGAEYPSRRWHAPESIVPETYRFHKSDVIDYDPDEPFPVVKCAPCKGTGRLPRGAGTLEKCSTCRGYGRVTLLLDPDKRLEIVPDGTPLGVRGEGASVDE